MLKDRRILLLSVLFGLLSFLWSLETISGPSDKSNLLVFTNLYGLVALFGGIFGLLVSRKWGGLRSYIGRAVVCFSLGLLLQEFGQIAYMYYIFVLHVSVPYPSWGDLGFFGSIPAYILGSLYLFKILGIKSHYSISASNKLVISVFCLVLLSFTYIVLMRGYVYDSSNFLRLALDIGYPLGQSFYIFLASSAYFISSRYLGGLMRANVIVIISALLMQYFSDFVFLYTARSGVWVPGGINDFMYMVSYYLMAISLVFLDIRFNYLKGERSLSSEVSYS